MIFNNAIYIPIYMQDIWPNIDNNRWLTVKDGGKNFLFHLKEANWHDGTPVTAADIVWSLNRMSQPDVTRGRVTAIRTFYEHQTAVLDEPEVLVLISLVAGLRPRG